MPYQNLTDGLYLLKQKSVDKGVDHYGILDIGNRLQISQADGTHPVVIHQTPPSIRLDWLQNTGTWQVLGSITDEAMAMNRIKLAAQDSQYDLFGNNCEHFARFVATGVRESTQIKAAVAVAGLAVLAVIALR